MKLTLQWWGWVLAVVMFLLLVNSQRYSYEFGGPGNGVLYRHDRLTGSTVMSVFGSEWRALQ